MAGNGNGNGKGGRPSKLTPEVLAEIEAALEDGCSDKDAAEGAGICYSTFRAWFLRGEKAKTGEYLEFSQRITRARAKGNWTMVKELKKTTKGRIFLLKCRGYIPVERAEVEHSGAVATLHIHPTDRKHSLAEEHGDDGGGEEGE